MDTSLEVEIRVQVCTLRCNNYSYTFGVQICTISETGAHLNPEYSCLHSLKHICTLKGSNIQVQVCTPEGYKELRLQTCTLTGA